MQMEDLGVQNGFQVVPYRAEVHPLSRVCKSLEQYVRALVLSVLQAWY